MNKIYCNDGCQKEFPFTKAGIGFETLPNNIERHYLECPHCKKQYTSYYLNDDIKMIQAEIKRLSGKSLLKVKQRNKLAKLKQKAIFMSRQLKMEVESNV